MTIDVLDITRHRNGISGEPFSLVIFSASPEGKELKFSAVVFDDPGYCAVVCLDMAPFDSSDNSSDHNFWRGDWFEPELREAIKKFESNLDLDEIVVSTREAVEEFIRSLCERTDSNEV